MKRTYPIEFEHGRIVKLVAPGKEDGAPTEVTIDISQMEPGTKHRLEVTAEGQIHIYSDEPFIEIPEDLPEEEVDEYTTAMTEKANQIQQEILDEVRDAMALEDD